MSLENWLSAPVLSWLELARTEGATGADLVMTMAPLVFNNTRVAEEILEEMEKRRWIRRTGWAPSESQQWFGVGGRGTSCPKTRKGDLSTFEAQACAWGPGEVEPGLAGRPLPPAPRPTPLPLPPAPRPVPRKRTPVSNSTSTSNSRSTSAPTPDPVPVEAGDEVEALDRILDSGSVDVDQLQNGGLP